MTIDGLWHGHYENPSNPKEGGGSAFGIAAQFVQEGRDLKGTMTDIERTVEVPLEKLIEDGFFKGWSEDQKRGALFLERRSQNLRLRSVLPEHSELVGAVHGRVVKFEKRYMGSTSSCWVGDMGELGGHESPSSPVRYVGEIDASGTHINGTWRINRSGLFGRILRPLAQGAFSLERQ